MKFNFTKFTLPALLIAASASAFADEQPVVKLTGIDEPITWSAFVNAINNPVPVEVELDPNSAAAKAYTSALNRQTTANNDLKAKKGTLAAAEKELEEANIALNGKPATEEGQEEIPGAQKEYNAAKKAQSDAATDLTNAQDAYKEANDEYTDAIGNQSDAQNQLSTLNEDLTTANQNVANVQAQIKEQLTDVLATKRATFEANKTAIQNANKQAGVYLDMRDSYVQTTYNKVTEQWLVDAKADAEILRNSFKPNGTATDTKLYYKANVSTTTDYNDDDEEITITNVTLMLSFVPQDGWYENSINTAFTDIRTTYTDIKNSTIINKVQIYFGYTDGKPNYGTNSILTIAPSVKYSLVSDNIATAIEGIDEKNYQTDGKEGTTTITNQQKYDDYNDLYEAEIKTVNDLTSENGTLETEISNLETKINTKNDPLYTQLAEAQAEVIRLNGGTKEDGTVVTGEIPALKSKIAGYTATVNKYRATSYTDAEGKVIECKDAAGNAITYLKWLSNQQTAAQNAKTKADNDYAAAQDALNAATAAVNTASTKVSNAESAVANAQTEVNNADAAVASAKVTYDAAQEAANAAATAAAQEKYNEITLTAGTVIDATEPITKEYKGTIYGHGSIFNVNITATENNTQTSLFNKFSGTVEDVAINGTFANSIAGAQFADVVRWDGNGKIYDERGNETSFSSNTLQNAFGAFGFALRDNEYYGVKFDGRKIVKVSEAPSKVFSLTAYDVPANDNAAPVATQKYVQLKTNGSTEMVTLDNNALTDYAVPTNRFAKSATADVAGKKLTNVYYGDNNTCDNVVIEDQVKNENNKNVANFYCPDDITAKKVVLNRSLKKGYNTVCLPFALNYNYSTAITSICDYDRVDEERFWFTKIDETSTPLAANTPALLVMESAVDNLEINNDVTIAKTTKQIVAGNGMTDDSKTYGTFMPADRSQIYGKSQEYYIYGLNSNGKFQAGSASATFPAFRMVIWANQPAAPLTKALSNGDYIDIKGIGIHDEYGNDITDDQMSGVDDVIADGDAAKAITVAGGQGEIIITAKADYGKVEIYNLNGVLIDYVDVIEGTTTVGVSKGFYIVMGQKVVVK